MPILNLYKIRRNLHSTNFTLELLNVDGFITHRIIYENISDIYEDIGNFNSGKISIDYLKDKSEKYEG